VAATSRGDFYRAVLLLNDAVGRLQDDPQGKSQLAYANAYLAWAYQGLNRADEARAAADRALRTDPGIAGGLDNFPATALALFKRPR
jgi:tetratricopeptide (TPR) repeat protein